MSSLTLCQFKRNLTTSISSFILDKEDTLQGFLSHYKLCIQYLNRMRNYTCYIYVKAIHVSIIYIYIYTSIPIYFMQL